MLWIRRLFEPVIYQIRLFWKSLTVCYSNDSCQTGCACVTRSAAPLRLLTPLERSQSGDLGKYCR